MDPEANLKEQLELCEDMKSIIDNEDRDTDDLLKLEDKANRLIDLVEALDQWISRSGFLPKKWHDAQKENFK